MFDLRRDVHISPFRRSLGWLTVRSRTLYFLGITTFTLADLSNYQPTAFLPSYTLIHTAIQESYPHTGDGWISWNQPSFQPCALRYEGWNGVGFCKTNLHSTYRLWYTKVGTWLVFAKPTVGFLIWGLEIGWFRVNFLHKATKHGWTSPRG